MLLKVRNKQGKVLAVVEVDESVTLEISYIRNLTDLVVHSRKLHQDLDTNTYSVQIDNKELT